MITNITHHAQQRATERYQLDPTDLSRFIKANISLATPKGRDRDNNLKLQTITGLVLVIDTVTHTLITVW